MFDFCTTEGQLCACNKTSIWELSAVMASHYYGNIEQDKTLPSALGNR